MQLTLQIVLAVVLLWAGLAKLRDRWALTEAVPAHGVPVPLRRAAGAALVAVELALAVLVLVPGTSRPGAWAVAALGLVFAGSLARMRLAGVERAPCGCFGGAVERPVTALAARALGLSALGALAASGVADRPGPSSGVLAAVAIGVLALAVAALAVLVLSLLRRLDALEARPGPSAALEPPDEDGPPVGLPAPTLAGLARSGAELVAFHSPGCRDCADLEPALQVLRRAGLPVVSVAEDADPSAFELFDVPGTPFVVYAVDGVVAARGPATNLEQIEELIGAGQDRVRAPA